MSDNQNSRVYGFIVTILLALSAVIGFFFWQKSKSYMAEKDKAESERQELVIQKVVVEHELDSLSNAYSSLRTENENLQGKVTITAAQVEEKEKAIRQIKATTARDIAALREQVAQLQRTKIELETIISTLRIENDSLRAENQRLAGENTELKGANTQLTGQVQDLAKQLEEQIRKTQSANFKATSFRVWTARKNEKMTTKARKSREIDVSFDLADVPEPYQGPQKLYMVITDDKGKPIPSDNPTIATVYAPTGPVEIQAQQVKAVVLESTQRMSFHHKFDEKLKSGNYVVAVYCDKGLLGASSFKLN
jgi:peptidoglycan hydrolase CwlO-like protein